MPNPSKNINNQIPWQLKFKINSNLMKILSLSTLYKLQSTTKLLPILLVESVLFPSTAYFLINSSKKSIKTPLSTIFLPVTFTGTPGLLPLSCQPIIHRYLFFFILNDFSLFYHISHTTIILSETLWSPSFCPLAHPNH